MAGKRPTNSELHLQRLEADDEARRAEEKGILEVFPRDEDEPISRDDEPVDEPVDEHVDEPAGDRE
jgi:hypothetical protein